MTLAMHYNRELVRHVSDLAKKTISRWTWK